MNDKPHPRPRNLRNPGNNNGQSNTGSWNPFAGMKTNQAASGTPVSGNPNSGSESSGGGGGVLDEFVGNTGAHPQDERQESVGLNPAQEFQCYSEHATDLRMIDLRQVNGSFTALPYHYLETVDFIPTDGIVMKFSMATVKITGCRLHEVYRALLGYRVGFIQAVGNHFMPLIDDEDGEPAVEGITIETATDP